MVYISKSRRQIVVDLKGELCSYKTLCRCFHEGDRNVFIHIGFVVEVDVRYWTLLHIMSRLLSGALLV